MLGADCSHWQTPPLPWPAWVAGGLSVALVQVTHGTAPEPHAAEHLAGAAAANVAHVGVYHYLLPGNGTAQAEAFLAHSPGWIEFSALDVEEPGLTAADVMDFCAAYDAATHRPLVLYGNYSGLVGILNAHPDLKRYPVWWAQYSSKMTPPADLHVIGWQKLGSEPGFIGHLAPYPNPIDITDWFSLPGAPMTPIITHGPKLGIHSIQPGTTIPLVKQAIAAGWHWPLVKILHDASVCVDVKAISPQTLTICRYIPPSADDEGLQNVDQWTTPVMQAWAVRMIQLIFSRTPSAHLPAVDYWDVTNEPGAHGVAYYRALGLAFCELVREADRRSIHLSMPALPQGVPEWNEMIALTNTGLFGLMKKGGHIFDVHEGVFTDQPIDFGFGDVIPGGPVVTGAGSTNFRHRYLYDLLAQRGEVVPLVISEFYGGGRYTNPPADQLARFSWYDQRARQEPYLLAFLPFTINPDGGWVNADYGNTYASAELWQYIANEKDKPNGDDDMQPIYHARALIDLVLRDAAGNVATDPLAQSPDGHVVLKGTTLHVYAAGVTAGGFTNRVTVTPGGANVWGVATAIVRM